jgi:transcription termination/antitermination protein NusG
MSNDRLEPWIAIQTKPRHERAVARQLQCKGYVPFLPSWRVRRRWSDRVREIEQPLFDGYLFCRIDLDRPLRVITTPGVIRLVGMSGRPVPIAEHEIASLQRIVTSSAAVAPWPFLSTGSRIRIESGCLAGVEGILERSSGGRRVVVSVLLLQRSVAVELDREVVSPV